MDKVITTALLVVAGVVAAMFMFNSMFPIINRSSTAMMSMAGTIDERMKSRISIVHAANTTDLTTVYIWVKNVGSMRLAAIEKSDLFLGLETDYIRIPYTSDAGGGYPRWSYSLENDTEWKVGATLKITVTYQSSPDSGTYFVKFIIPNGISDEYYFSM
ncbi:MAG: hypothetical protein HYX96_02475 [Chloroflexi bacterium]|nr:hypothetical protein [Chloroflexota bacterium]